MTEEKWLIFKEICAYIIVLLFFIMIVFMTFNFVFGEHSDYSMHYYCEEHIVEDITFNINPNIAFATLYNVTIETGEVLISRDKSLNVGSKYKMKIYRYCDDNMLDDEGNLSIRHISEVIYVGDGD